MKKILFIILVLSGLLLPAQTNNIETGTTFYVSEGTSVYFSGVAIDGLLSVQAVNAETEIVIDGEITGDANFELNGNKVNLTLNAGTWNVLNADDEYVNNLFMQATGVAEVPAAHSLTILGDFNNTNTTVGVKLLADASGYGQILTSGTVTNAGTTYAEQYLTSQTNAGWRQLASPVSTTLAEVDDDFETFYPNGPGPVGNAAQYNIWWYDASPINPNGTNVTANLLGSDADAKHFKAADNNTLAFGPANNARGFTIFSGSAFDITNAGVLDVSGVFGNGDYTFDCYRTHDFIAGQSGTTTQQLITGWNLIPNPYPSNIDVSNLLSDATNFDLAYKAVHVWNAKVQQYVAITEGAFIDWNTSNDTLGSAKNIAPFQAFWVKADYSNPSSNPLAERILP